MNKHTFASIFAIAVLALPLHVFAQPNAEGEPRLMMHLGDQIFVWNPEIAGILDLTPEQREEIQKVVQAYQAQGEQRRRISQGEEIGDENQPIIKSFEQSFAEIRDGINTALEPEQQTKYSEMTFQLAGGLGGISVNTQMLEHVVDLTPEQKEQISEIVKARNIAFTNNPDIVKRHIDLVRVVLKSEQITRLEKLTAEIPALREQLKMPDPAQRPSASQAQVRPQPSIQQPSGYVPGSGSWQPGMPLPTAPPPVERGRFPRSDN